MSARVRLATPDTVKFGASTTVTGGPSFGFTIRFWPSSFSIVPRTGIGVPSLGACAKAEPAISVSMAIANAGARNRQERFSDLIDIGVSSELRLDAVLLGGDAGGGDRAVRLFRREDRDRRAGLQ